MRWIIRIFFLLALVAIVVGGAAWYKDRAERPTVSYRTGKVARADILATISAILAAGSHYRGPLNPWLAASSSRPESGLRFPLRGRSAGP